MTLADYAICGAADLTLAQFRRILTDAGSPAAIEAEAMYIDLLAEEVRPSVFLAFFKQESRFGTQGIVVQFQTHNPGNVRSPEFTSALTAIVDTPRGKFAQYPTWESGTRDWAFRMTGPKYAGAGLTTIRTVLPKYAPSGDQDNSPTAYIAAVLDSIEEWTRQSGTGGATVALQKPAVISNPSPNHGYPGDYKPEAVAWHITAGSGASALSWLTNPASNASANYVITEDGKIHELVDPEAGQQGAAWANGQLDKPNMANPPVASWVNAGINPNRRTVSIEHAGQSSMGKGGSLTSAQIAATISLTAWICQRFAIAPDRTHIIPHSFIDSVNRANCPGFSNLEFDTWVGKIATLVKGTPPPVADPGFPGALQPDGRTVLNDVDFEGTAISVEEVTVQVRNAKGERYTRRWSGHTLAPWQPIT